MNETDFPKARSKDLVILTRSDETLVYDLVSNEAHCLNGTAAFVWSRCSGEASVADIARSVEKQFGHFVSDEFVGFALTELNDRKLMSSTGLTSRQRLSRREAIRKIGLASAVSVPIIASVVAPARAQGSLSCTGCTSPGQCFSQPACGNFCDPIGNCVPKAVTVTAPARR